ncbi:helix-turn-helix domain-containing protein [Cystobacter fuscus]
MSAQVEAEPKLSVRIGAAAREARKRAKLTQEDVAERLGFAPEVYGRMERGVTMPSVPTLKKICQALGVTASSLLAVETMKPPARSASRQAKQEDSPEIRRLLRRLRTLSKPQLDAIRIVANLMRPESVKRGSRRPNHRKSKSAKPAPHGK